VCRGKFSDENSLYLAAIDREAKQLGYPDRESQSIDADGVRLKNLNELSSYCRLN
jgi:hypothetical protein